jgi:hypothetical protein
VINWQFVFIVHCRLVSNNWLDLVQVVKMCLCSDNVTSVAIRDPGIMNGSRC